ncbi:hypothetical protein ACR9VJ_31570 [Streptomyces sp. H49]|uniref:hypothetical protein n=1 Tax=Streptomyces sp. H49 TaxID=3444117 RepID=UPI003F4AB6E1
MVSSAVLRRRADGLQRRRLGLAGGVLGEQRDMRLHPALGAERPAGRDPRRDLAGIETDQGDIGGVAELQRHLVLGQGGDPAQQQGPVARHDHMHADGGAFAHQLEDRVLERAVVEVAQRRGEALPAVQEQHDVRQPFPGGYRLPRSVGQSTHTHTGPPSGR